MQHFNEEYKKHKIHESIKDLKLSIKEAQKNITPKEDGVSDELNRLSLAVNFIEQKLKSAIPYLIDINFLDTLERNIEQTTALLVNFKETNSFDNVLSARKNLLSVIHSTSTIAAEETIATKDSLSEIITNFITESSEALLQINKSKNSFEKRVTELSNHILALEKDLNGIQENLKDEQNQINTLSTEHQKQFSEAQEKRSVAFNERIEDLQNRIATFVTEELSKINEHQEEAIKKINSENTILMEKLSNRDKEANKILESVGVKAHTYGYAAASKDEASNASWLRIGAIILMLLAVGILIGPSFIGLFDDEVFDWKEILFRIPTSLIVFIPAFYLAREASKHRDEHVMNKRIELELSALSPYLLKLDQNDQNQIKGSLVPNYFVGHTNKEIKTDKHFFSDILPNVIEKVVEKVLDRLDFPKKKV